jgi:AAA+ ATPase superfamily predicted ATPase
MKSKKSNLKFVGREKQLERVSRFLADQQGGAVLIAGDRGSGKTSLVEKAIAEADKKRGFLDGKVRKHTLSRQIVVRIPLIIAPDNPEQSTASYYRSMLMRAITRGLEGDSLTRRYGWLDLPKRWYRSIGYMQSLHRLVPYAKYTSLTKNWSKRFSVSKSPFNGGLDVVTAAELEISDTVLEMNLRNLFSTYSEQHDFILVIDELDKLSARTGSDKVKVEDIALLLKNLFNETGVHAFFVSDEPTLGRITKAIKDNPFCEEQTLFKDTVLLNQMHPDEFEELIKPFTKGADTKTKLKHTASLSLLTRMMPSEVKRFDLQHGGDMDRLVDNQKAQLGSYDYSYRATMQVYINHVYREYCGKHGYYYDRVLYKALTEAGNSLLDVSSNYFKWNQYITLLYPTALFANDTEERNFKNAAELDETIIGQQPTIITLIDELNSDEKSSISFAVGKLIVLLDRSGWLNLKLVDTTLIQVNAFYGDTFHIENLDADIDGSLRIKEEEQLIVDRINQFGHIYLTAIGQALWSNLWPTCIHIPNAHDGRGVKALDNPDNDYEHMLNVFWEALGEKIEEAPGEIAGAISAKINSQIKPPVVATHSIINDYEIDITVNKKRVKVVISFGQRLNVATAGYDKVLVLYEGEQLFPKNTNKAVKQFKMTKGWQNLNSVLVQIVEIISALR